MVNEERLRHLIKMAQFDTNEGKRCKPMTQFSRKDYVALQVLKSFVAGTITYMLMFVIWALYSMDELIKKMTGNQIRGFAVTVIVLYLIFLVVYMLATYIVFQVKYTDGRKRVKRYYNSLKRVNQMYEREDRLKAPGNKDWE